MLSTFRWQTIINFCTLVKEQFRFDTTSVLTLLPWIRSCTCADTLQHVYSHSHRYMCLCQGANSCCWQPDPWIYIPLMSPCDSQASVNTTINPVCGRKDSLNCSICWCIFILFPVLKSFFQSWFRSEEEIFAQSLFCSPSAAGVLNPSHVFLLWILCGVNFCLYICTS